MGRMIGFLATWTTYGTWLQGNKKGYVKNGKILGPTPELEQSNSESLKHESVKIPKHLRETVKNAIVKEAQELGQKIYAIAVCSNHVHIVVEHIGAKCGYSVGRFKKQATKELRKCGFDKRYCYNEQELDNKIKYVQQHND